MAATVFPAPGAGSGSIQWNLYSNTTTASSSASTVTITGTTSNSWVGTTPIINSGTGQFANNTIITSVVNSTSFTVNVVPTVALSSANISIAMGSMQVVADNSRTVGKLRSAITVKNPTPNNAYFNSLKLRSAITVKDIPGSDYKFNVKNLQKQIEVFKNPTPRDGIIYDAFNINKWKMPPNGMQLFFPPSSSNLKKQLEIFKQPGATYGNYTLSPFANNLWANRLNSNLISVGQQSPKLLNYTTVSSITTSGSNTLLTVNNPSSTIPYITSGQTYYGVFNGTSQYLSSPNINFSTNNFTIEGWFYPTSIGSYVSFWGTDMGSGANPKLAMYIQSGGGNLYVDYGGTIVISILASSIITTNAWNHIALVRSGTGTNQTILYVNGSAVASGTIGNLNTVTNPFNIGYIGESGLTLFPGYISNFRVVNSKAVYTGSFTPLGPLSTKQSARQNVAALGGNETVLLALQTATVTADSSVNNFTLTNVGSIGSPTLSIAVGTVPAVNDYALITDTVTNYQALAPIGSVKVLSIDPTVSYLMVAGGGGGGAGHTGTWEGGGGGAGGMLTGTTTFTPQTVYNIVVGTGGAGGGTGAGSGTNGTNTTFNGLTAIGGGYGGGGNGGTVGGSGGSGGGAWSTGAGSGTNGQGNAGGNGNNNNIAGGGGGAGSSGGAPNGGNGLSSSITGSAVYYAGGGGGSTGTGGSGGGGGGGYSGSGSGVGYPGSAGTGGGGGGGGSGSNYAGGAGGSGVVIISIPTAIYSGITTGSPTVVVNGNYTVLIFTGATGSYTTGAQTNNTYILSVPTSGVSNLNINNPWAYQLWDPEVFQQSNVVTNTAPATARERLYYSTLAPGRYGNYIPYKTAPGATSTQNYFNTGKLRSAIVIKNPTPRDDIVYDAFSLRKPIEVIKNPTPRDNIAYISNNINRWKVPYSTAQIFFSPTSSSLQKRIEVAKSPAQVPANYTLSNIFTQANVVTTTAPTTARERLYYATLVQGKYGRPFPYKEQTSALANNLLTTNINKARYNYSTTPEPRVYRLGKATALTKISNPTPRDDIYWDPNNLRKQLEVIKLPVQIRDYNYSLALFGLSSFTAPGSPNTVIAGQSNTKYTGTGTTSSIVASSGNITVTFLKPNGWNNLPTIGEYMLLTDNTTGNQALAPITASTIPTAGAFNAPQGQAVFTTSTAGGTYVPVNNAYQFLWQAPSNVYRVAAVAIGGGGGGGNGGVSYPAVGGGGGALAYTNNISVTPLQYYTVQVGAGGTGVLNVGTSEGGGNGGASYFKDSSTVYASGGSGGISNTALTVPLGQAAFFGDGTYTGTGVTGSGSYSSGTNAYTFTWTAPANVYSVSVVAIGAGGGGGAGYSAAATGGGGGGLGYRTYIAVSPFTTYTVQVGAYGSVTPFGSGGAGGDSYFISNITVLGGGGGGGLTNGAPTGNLAGGSGGTHFGEYGNAFGGGGPGGNGGGYIKGTSVGIGGGGGGGGAAGYANGPDPTYGYNYVGAAGGPGGNGAGTGQTPTAGIVPTTGGGYPAGSGGGGGGGWGPTASKSNGQVGGASGGGTGIFGATGSGGSAGAAAPSGGTATAGGSGDGGNTPTTGGPYPAGSGGTYGGGGGGSSANFGWGITGLPGGIGAVRIIWPAKKNSDGSTVRAYPSTLTSDQSGTINDGANNISGSTGGTYVGDNGGNGGAGGGWVSGSSGGIFGSGGGGAGGYGAAGGYGGDSLGNSGISLNGSSGASGTSGSGGGGGASGYGTVTATGGAGGGVGVLGAGSNGSAGSAATSGAAPTGGGGGSGGIAGGNGSTTFSSVVSVGGAYGGGGGGVINSAAGSIGAGAGAPGAVRLIWPSNKVTDNSVVRAFPGTAVNDQSGTVADNTGAPSYIVTIPSAYAANLKTSNTWTIQMWEANIIPQLNVKTNQAPTTARERLYYDTIAPGKYGRYFLNQPLVNTLTANNVLAGNVAQVKLLNSTRPPVFYTPAMSTLQKRLEIFKNPTPNDATIFDAFNVTKLKWLNLSNPTPRDAIVWDVNILKRMEVLKNPTPRDAVLYTTPNVKVKFPYYTTQVLYTPTASNILKRIFTVKNPSPRDDLVYDVNNVNKFKVPSLSSSVFNTYSLNNVDNTILQILVRTNLAPTNPRENLYYAGLAPGKYGTIFPSKNSYNDPSNIISLGNLPSYSRFKSNQTQLFYTPLIYNVNNTILQSTISTNIAPTNPRENLYYARLVPGIYGKFFPSKNSLNDPSNVISLSKIDNTIAQSTVATTVSPVNPRERLFYSQLVPGKYGNYIPSKVSPGALPANVNAERLSNIDSNYWLKPDNQNVVAVGQASAKNINALSLNALVTATSGGGNTVLTYTPTYYGSFNGSSQYLYAGSFTPAQSAPTAPFAIECWVYNNAFSGCVVATSALGSTIPYVIGFSNGDNFSATPGPYPYYTSYNGSSWSTMLVSTTPCSLNTWYHFAVSYDGTTLRLFINGIQVNSQITSAPAQTSGGGVGFYIGRRWDLSGNNYFNGYISNFRFVKGKAVYTGNFTPLGPLGTVQPARPNVAALGGSETSLLTLQNTTIVDNSNFFGPIPYMSSSTYLAVGAANTLSFPAFTPVPQGPLSPFTIEYWVMDNYGVSSILAYNNYSLVTDTIPYSTGLNDGTSNGKSNGLYPFFGSYDGTTWSTISSPTPILSNIWYHIAVSFDGSVARLFVNGNNVASSNTMRLTTNPTNTGFTIYPTKLPGSMSNFRFVQGRSLYTNNFTPSGPLTAVPGTVLLTLQDAVPVDNSTNAYSVVNSGVVMSTSSGWPIQNGNPVISGTTLTTPTPAVNDYLLVTDTNNNQALAQITATTATTITVPSSSLANLNTNSNLIYQLWDPEVFAQTNVRTTTSTGVARENLYYATLAKGRYGRTFPNTVAPAAIRGEDYVLDVNTLRQLVVIKNPAPNDAVIYDPVTPSNFDTRYWAYPSNTNRIAVGTANPKLINYSTASSQLISGSNTILTFNNPAASINYMTSGSTYYGSFNGTSQYLTVPGSSVFAFGTGDFTIECWVYPNGTAPTSAPASNSNRAIFGYRSGSDTSPYLTWDYLGVGLGGDISNYLQSSYQLTLNTWTHIAAVRLNGTATLYINGSSVYTTSQIINFSDSVGTRNIGFFNGANPYYWQGYISNLRVVKGVAVYTGNFTPLGPLSTVQPTRPNVQALGGTETALLTLQNAAFVDNSVIVTQPTYIPSSTYGGVFNSNNYLSIPTNSLYNFGTGNFTVECWVNFTGSTYNFGVFHISPTLLPSTSAGLAFAAISGAGGWIIYYGGTSYIYPSTIFTNTWYHIALVRLSSVIYLYINGVPVYSAADTFNYTNNAVAIGGYYSTAYIMTGYISNFRVVNGTAVYTGAFTPVGPLNTTQSSRTNVVGLNGSETSLLALKSSTAITDTAGLNTITNNNVVTATTFPVGQAIVNVGTVTTTQSTALGTVPAVNDYVLITDTVTNNQALAQIGAVTSTSSGSTYISPVQTYSGFFNSSSQYLSATASGWLSTNGTIEAWIYLTSYASNYSGNYIADIASAQTTNTNNQGWQYGIIGTVSSYTTMNITFWSSLTPSQVSVDYPFNLNTWYHTALVKTGSSFNFYVNGSQVGTTQTSSFTIDYTKLRIGGLDNSNFLYSFPGYISNFRITNTAVYSGNFTVPTSPLSKTQSAGTNIAALSGTETLILTLQNLTIVDNGSNSVSISNSGVTISNSITPTFTTTVTSTNGTYTLSVPTSSVANLNINNPWAYQLWEADLMPQSNLLPNTSPITARDRLYYSTTTPGRYGRYFPSQSTQSVLPSNVLSGNLNIDSLYNWVKASGSYSKVVFGSARSANVYNPYTFASATSSQYNNGSTTQVYFLNAAGIITSNDYVRITDGAGNQALAQITVPLVSGGGTQVYTVQAGQQVYTSLGSSGSLGSSSAPSLVNGQYTYTFITPANVYSVSVVAVGGGGSGSAGWGLRTPNGGGVGGGGGGLAWVNNIPVVPGQSYTVVIGTGGVSNQVSYVPGNNGNDSYFISPSIVKGGGGVAGGVNAGGAGGTYTAYTSYGTYGGGAGGAGAIPSSTFASAGGGGAGGYTAAGGAGGNGVTPGTAGSGGGGGGGNNTGYNSAGGGGVGLLGSVANGVAGNGGTGGSGGGTGGAGGNTINTGGPYPAGAGGAYGGGGGGSFPEWGTEATGPGSDGAIRIIWPGTRDISNPTSGQSADTTSTVSYSASATLTMVPSSLVSNLNTNTTWTITAWDPSVYQQSNWITNLNPTTPRDMLYYATLAIGRYGRYFPSKADPRTTTPITAGNVVKFKQPATKNQLFYSPTSNRLEVINSAYWTDKANRNIVVTGQASSKTPILYPVPIAQTVSGSNVLLTFNNSIPSINYMTLGATNYGVFNGSSQYLTIPNSIGFNLAGGVWTVECWFYTTGNYSTYRAIIAKRVGNGAASWEGYLAVTTGYMGFYNGTIYNSTTTPSANVWHHGAWVYDGVNINIYLDGVNIFQTPVTITEQPTATIQIANIVGNSEYFSGYISNLRIVKGVAVYAGNFTPQGPLSRIQSARTNVAALSGGETALLTLQNTTIVDNSAYSISQIPYISPTPTYYASFNGTNQYLTLPYSSLVDLSTQTWTMEAWFNPTTFTYGCQLASKDTYGVNYDWQLYADATSISLYTKGATTNYTVVTGITITTGTWHHLAFVRNAGTLNFFLDGVKYGPGSTMAITNNSVTNWTIGCNGWNSPNSFFNGYMSNFRIVQGQALYTNNFTPAGPLNVITGTSILALQSSSTTTDVATNFTITNNNSVSMLSSPVNIITNVNTVTTVASTFGAGSTPPATNDYLLLTDNSTSNQAIAPIGSITVTSSVGTTTVIVPAQTYSVQFNGTSSYITTNASGSLGTQFTMEAFFYLSSNLTYQVFGGTYWGKIFTTQTSGGFEMGISGTSTSGGVPTSIFIGAYGAGASYPLLSNINPLTIALNTWHHFAISRNGSNWAIWLDGINIPISYGGTGASGNAYLGGQIYIGAAPSSPNYYGWFPGYISNARIVTGSSLPYDPAVVSGNISVPTAPLTAVAGTYLLTLQSATYVDNSTNTFTISGTNTNISSTITPSFTTTAIVGVVNNSYTLSVPSLNVSNLNINNSWTAQIWDPEVITQATVRTNLPPVNARENLYYAQLIKGKYGTQDLISSQMENNTSLFLTDTGQLTKYRTSAFGKGLADPSAAPKAPVQFWN